MAMPIPRWAQTLTVALVATCAAGLATVAAREPAAEEPLAERVATIAAAVESYWRGVFRAAEIPYDPAAAVLYAEREVTDCGPATEDSKAFYCPRDDRIYLADGFFAETVVPYGEAGLIQVIAHEWGHHVQAQLGVKDDADRRAATVGGKTYDLIWELQADCLSGTYAAAADRRGDLAPRDIDGAIRLLYDEGGDPEGFGQGARGAHGTGAQRVRLFLQGYFGGDGLTGCGNLKPDGGTTDRPAG